MGQWKQVGAALTGATDSGHIRVFRYEDSSDGGSTGQQWKQVVEALMDVGGENDYFGTSVSMSADGAVVAGGASKWFRSDLTGRAMSACTTVFWITSHFTFSAG